MTESTVKDDAILQCSIFIFFAEGRRHDKILESDQSLFSKPANIILVIFAVLLVLLTLYP